MSTDNGSPLFAFVAFDQPVNFLGTTVDALFDLYRSGVFVPTSGVSIGAGGLRIFHTTDAGNVDTVVYRTPDPGDLQDHFGRTDGPLSGPFHLPVPLG